MSKRAVIRLAVAAIGGALIFIGIGPALVDRLSNQIVPASASIPSAKALAMMPNLDIIDLHADPLLWRRDIARAVPYGHVDYPRLARGGVAIQVFSSVTKTPKNQNYESNGSDTDNLTLLSIVQAQPIRTWASLLQRSLYHAEKLAMAEKNTHGNLRIIRSVADVKALMVARRQNPAFVGGLLSVEGLQNIEGKLSNVDALYDAGFRMLGLAHFFDNEVAGSVHGIKKYGLTTLGHDVVRKMENRGMIIDIAHASHKTISDVIAVARKPIVFSHGGVKGTCNTNRNLTDDEIRGIAKTGGIIGIGYWKTAICDASAKGVAKAMTYVRDLVGARYVALGSDFDGAVQTPFDSAQLALVVQALMDAGWSEPEITDAMGGNALRVFTAALPAQ
jgi:membrane dipeptidase